MSQLESLKQAKNKRELANTLNVSAVFLTNLLYRIKTENLYQNFSIPKKSGGNRDICAPNDQLKNLQHALSLLLLNCLDEIRQQHKISPQLSHGFERRKTIITNAHKHLRKKNILNLDLENFFDSFNFGRVRGFFIKNIHFQLTEEVATTIAQIACFDNKLPQGSPCSPVITNLICNILDIRLNHLARKNNCT